MKLVFFIVFSLLAFSCGKKGGLETPPLPPVGMPSASTYLALGDSYTIGQSVPQAERFPAQTVAILRQQGVSVENPVYIAQTGWTTGNLQSAIEAQNPPASFDVVTLLIGVNDQYQRMDTGGYALRFTRLLEKSISLAKGRKDRVFVLSIPDYSATPFVPERDKERVAKEIDLFNAVNSRIAGAYGVSYTDITPSSREAAGNSSLVATDNLHPSGAEYRKWAELLAPKIKAAL
jgi:lysophospholipase L1-like esterase